LRRLLEAFAVAGVQRDVRLILSGRCDQRIFGAVKDLRLEGSVKFVDLTADEDLSSVYRGALGFVFPSLYEGFGLPPLEAMACGTPVLTSNVCALPETVGDAALLVNPIDVEAIADGIRRLVEDSALRNDLRQHGLDRSRQFSWEATARRTRAILESAAPLAAF
jgi:glycosyltransferase involved in cell wall biosynthesis